CARKDYYSSFAYW
nr:immunoglobulin heavy chain junction region [Mus musculus]MBK4186337.1 immunoglobulin heavy chain junction region [Mus musculus]MBK4186338.1 immunoglobulin heavy chain junction region [Mus musculus]MBK4186339.1 immunoglobulin heavy chain junction region [Mus musculus]MBK4186340.1 immunoglobulin heavy chain junction region [Mus musculus]